MRKSRSAPRPAPRARSLGNDGAAPASTTLALAFEPWHGINPAPITAMIAGRRYTMPAMNAGEWFTAMGGIGWLSRWRFLPHAEHDPDGLGAAMLIELMCAGAADAYRLSVAVDDGRVSARDLAGAARRVFERAAGCPWWTAERIAMQSVSWSGIGGALYLSGLRPDVPLPVWLGGAYRTWMSLVDDKERSFADTALTLPPPGYDSGDVQLASSIDELFT
jgi:hypothetical protein